MVWVPTRLMAAHRRLHAATGSKSDPADAAAAARAAMAMPELDRHRIDERVRELRALVDYRDDVVKRRTMAINQLKAQAHLWLDRTPGDLTQAKALSELTALADGARLGRHVRQVLAAMAEEIAGLNQRVRDLDAALRDLVAPLAPNLLAITGISHNSAAVLIAEIGDITRWRIQMVCARSSASFSDGFMNSSVLRGRLLRLAAMRARSAAE